MAEGHFRRIWLKSYILLLLICSPYFSSVFCCFACLKRTTKQKVQQTKWLSSPCSILFPLVLQLFVAVMTLSWDGWRIWGPISGQNPLGKTLHVLAVFKKMKGNLLNSYSACNMYCKVSFWLRKVFLCKIDVKSTRIWTINQGRKWPTRGCFEL